MLDYEKRINFDKDIVRIRKQIMCLRTEIGEKRYKLKVLEDELVEHMAKLTAEVKKDGST
jgi:hypothetical protein